MKKDKKVIQVEIKLDGHSHVAFTAVELDVIIIALREFVTKYEQFGMKSFKLEAQRGMNIVVLMELVKKNEDFRNKKK